MKIYRVEAGLETIFECVPYVYALRRFTELESIIVVFSDAKFITSGVEELTQESAQVILDQWVAEYNSKIVRDDDERELGRVKIESLMRGDL